MNVAVLSRVVVRLTGVILIVSGGLFWTGHAMALIRAHMLLGVVLVLGLWTLAAAAARAGVGRGLVSLAFVWGIAVIVLGYTQDRLLIGDIHWVARVLHLTGGLVAIGQAEFLAAGIRRARTPAPSP